MPERDEDSLPRMPFLQHLAELRKVLVTALVVLVAGTAAAWFASGRILSVLTKLMPGEDVAHIFSPPEAFLIRLKVSAATALFVGVPVILFQIWRFLAPALYGHERRRLIPLFLVSTGLFYGGTVFAYLVITPIMLAYFWRLVPAGVMMTVGISQLFAIVAKLSVAFGVVFQLPLIIFMLSLMGLVSPRWLLRQWRIALVVLLVFSAVLTPPDIISQLFMTVPLFLLYLVSVGLSLLVERRRPPAGSVDTPEGL